jgi:hypothetical protein
MKRQDISREELFALVWEKPTIEVAQDLGVSDVAVAKLCARLQLPKPPRGYWARVQSGTTPRRPPLAAFREELEAKRKRDAKSKQVGTPLSELQRKFLDRALHELAAADVSLIDVRIVSNRIVAMPGDVAAAALILIQNRHVKWVETGTVDVTLSEGARRSLGGLVEKLLAFARPQALILEEAGITYGSSKGPLVVVRMPAALQERIADLVRIVKDRGLHHVVLPLTATEHAWVATSVYFADRYARSETLLCISATEIWATCTISTPGYLGAEESKRTVTTERVALRAVMPIDLLQVREVSGGAALGKMRVRDHWPRLRALIEAERVLDMLDVSQCELGSDVPDERLAIADRVLFGEERRLLAARQAYHRVWEELERWREELDAERADLGLDMLGLQQGDVVVHPKRGSLVRIELDRAEVHLRDGRIGFTLHGKRFRKDGLPGKRHDILFLDIDSRDPGK